MRATKTALLILEFVIAFFAVTYLWILSVIVSPLTIIALFTGADENFIPLILTIAGGFGFWGIIQLAIKIISPKLPVTEPKRLKVFLCSGVASLVLGGYFFEVSSLSESLMFLVPILATLHFIYLGRSYLWSSS